MTPEGTDEDDSFDLLDRWLTHHESAGRGAADPAATRDADPARQPDPSVTSSPADRPAEARSTTTPSTTPVVTITPTPSSIDLTAARTGGRIGAFLLLAATVVTVLAAAVAYAGPSRSTIGFALLMVLVTIVCWRLSAGQGALTVLLTGSRLEIVRAGSRYVFDLADTRSAIDVIGLPDDRGWRVLFYRRGMAPYVVDSSMVDPVEFMRLLHAHRSEVHYRPR